MRLAAPFPLLLLIASACQAHAGSASCGIDALTGPLAVKEAFGLGLALTSAPEERPSALPVRLIAGPAWRGVVAPDSAGGWLVTTSGTVSPKAPIGYGVLVMTPVNAPLGVLAFDGRAVRGAAVLGHLVIRDTTVPLLGVRMDPRGLHDSLCPLFPDSLR